MWTKTGLGSYSGRLWKAFLFISFRAANAAKKRLLSVGTDGGGYIIYYVPIKMISLVTGPSIPLTASTTQQRTPLNKDKGEAVERKRKPQ